MPGLRTNTLGNKAKLALASLGASNHDAQKAAFVSTSNVDLYLTMIRTSVTADHSC